MKATISSIICFGYKELGGPTRVISLWDNPKVWSGNVNADKWLCERIAEILADADMVVTHNGKRFDWKFIQTRFMVHGIPFLPKIKHFDTCLVARGNLLSYNNKLGTIAGLAGGKKLDSGGWELWEKVYYRDLKAMRTMAHYCKGDVIALEKAYLKLRPLGSVVPHFKGECKSCGSKGIKRSGFRYTAAKKIQRYQCNDCKSYI